MPSNEPILSCRSLSFSFNGGNKLLYDTDAEFEKGSFNHITGPSGSGKSTFLRLCNMLEQPDSGNILFRKKPLREYPPPELRRRICYLQQVPTLLAGTVGHNLLLPFRFAANSSIAPPDEETLLRLMGDFGLRGVALNDQALNLSGGQKQRVCLIRSLLLAPEIILLDEPVSALDADSKESVESAIIKLNSERGITVLLASHQRFNSGTLPTTVFEIRDGRLRERKQS